MHNVGAVLSIIVFIIITAFNYFIFHKYRGSKFDRAYLYILVTYNFGYLIQTIMGIIELTEDIDSQGFKARYEGIVRFFSDITFQSINASIILFSNEMHRVKALILAENPKEHHRKMKKNKLRNLIMTYIFILVSFVSHILIAIRTYNHWDLDLGKVLFITAASFFLVIDTFLYVYLITGMFFFVRRAKTY